MKSIIIDDEESARSRLQRLLAAHVDVEVVAEARDGLEAVEKIEDLRPDLVFLDIEMPGLGGFDVLQSLQSSVPLPLVIFITGFDQHALAAFEANALAYLLKPIRPERLAQAVEHARKLVAANGAREREEQHLLQVARESPQPLRQIVCRKRDRLLLVSPEQIFWFRVEGGVVKARTELETYHVNYQISELEARLPEEQFFRARREVLVNLNRIKEIRPYFKSSFVLIMSDPAASEIEVSARQASQFRQRIPGL
jgi:two-component system, LytTR family, response regulator